MILLKETTYLPLYVAEDFEETFKKEFFEVFKVTPLEAKFKVFSGHEFNMVKHHIFIYFSSYDEIEEKELDKALNEMLLRRVNAFRTSEYNYIAPMQYRKINIKKGKDGVSTCTIRLRLKKR